MKNSPSACFNNHLQNAEHCHRVSQFRHYSNTVYFHLKRSANTFHDNVVATYFDDIIVTANAKFHINVLCRLIEQLTGGGEGARAKGYQLIINPRSEATCECVKCHPLSLHPNSFSALCFPEHRRSLTFLFNLTVKKKDNVCHSNFLLNI